MLTQKDLDEIESLTKKAIKEEIRLLPTKNEFFSGMDKLLGEVKAMREEQTLINSNLSDHDDTIKNYEERIIKLEQSA